MSPRDLELFVDMLERAGVKYDEQGFRSDVEIIVDSSDDDGFLVFIFDSVTGALKSTSR